MEIRQRSVGWPARRVGAVAAGLLNLAGAVVLALIGFIANALRCDDNCAVGAPGWRNDPNAWQWSAGLYLTLAIFVAGIALNVSLWTRSRRQWPVAAVVVQLGVLVLLTILAVTEGPTAHITVSSFAPIVMFFAASGAVCIGLAEAWWLE